MNSTTPEPSIDDLKKQLQRTKKEMERRGQIIVHLMTLNRELYDELEQRKNALGKIVGFDEPDPVVNPPTDRVD
jgi:hypothetical protein